MKEFDSFKQLKSKKDSYRKTEIKTNSILSDLIISLSSAFVLSIDCSVHTLLVTQIFSFEYKESSLHHNIRSVLMLIRNYL
jgi:hypothetical protein